jgi:hypothetical protein
VTENKTRPRREPRGRACLYLKRVADVDPRALERLIRGTWRATGARAPR